MSSPPRPTAHDQEHAEAETVAPAPLIRCPSNAALAMVHRRGFRFDATVPNLPFPIDLPEPAMAEVIERLGHYAFRLFLRGAIAHPHGFQPTEATRYLSPEKAQAHAEALVRLGIAEWIEDGRLRLRSSARSFGGTLEWYVAHVLEVHLGFETAIGVRFGAANVGGDLDVVAAAEGKLVYLELKSSPPKHIAQPEIDAFVARTRALRPDLALFVVDTSLRLSDKTLPMLQQALGNQYAPRAIQSELWAITPRLFLVNAKPNLAGNISRAIAEGLRALTPPVG